MKISVIIPTYNAEKYIEKLLGSLLSQKLNETYIKNYEILIIDSSSQDKTKDIVQKIKQNFIKINSKKIDTDIKYVCIKKEEFNHGSTRTKAGKISKGDVLIYMTQDALPVNEYTVLNIIKPFIKDNKIGAAYGKQIPYKETNLFGKHLRHFNYKNSSYIVSYEEKSKYGIKTTFLSNSFAAYKRKVLEEINWFIDNIIFGEDQIAGARILKKGYKIAYIAEAVVYHSHSYSILEDFKRYFDIGVFHKTNKWLLEEFGKPEGEGLKYIKSEINFLVKKNPLKIPEGILRSILKYTGYKLGYHHEILPKNISKYLSMHKDWWEKT